MNQQTDNSGLTVSAGAVALVALVALAAVGAGNATGATAETGLTVETSWADALGESEELVAANVTSLGATGNATVWIEYREQNTSTWQESGNLTVSQTGEIRFEITGLEGGTTYEYRGVAAELDGNESDVGQVRTFTTDAAFAVETRNATRVDERAATLNGAVTDFGGASGADVGFQLRNASENTWPSTVDATLASDGSFSAEITWLVPGNTYEFRARGTATDGDSDTGVIRTFTADTAPAVRTGDATNVGETSATVGATVDSLGHASHAFVTVDYRQTGSSTWTVGGNTTIDAPGTFTFDLSGLDPGTDYEYRATLTANDGDTDTGTVRTFATDAKPAVETGDATAVGTTNATVTGDLTSLGGAENASVAVAYRQTGASSWQTTAGRTLTSPGTFTATLDGLSPGTDYEYRAVAVASDGDEATGAIRTVTTDAVEHAPSVDVLAAAEDSPPNPHAEVSVDWAVSDADGDLSTVSVTVTDSWGGTVASETEAVTGASASGSFYSKIKHGAGETYTVTVTVTDAGGRTTTDSTTVGA